MKRLQAFKFQIMPNGEQAHLMRRFAGCGRFVFNKALDQQQKWREVDPKAKFSYVKLANLLPGWKAEWPWLSEAPSQALQQSLKDLERAYSNFFAKRAAFPKFKKKSQGDSFRYPQGTKLDQGTSRVFLPKLGWLRYRNSRAVEGTVKNITVSQSAGKWYVAIQTEREVEQPIPHGGVVGLDVGIARFATLSDGAVFQPLNSFRKHEARLARYQRAMSRKTKFSNNWKKAKAKLQRIHARIGHARRDYLHQGPTTISQNHAIVCIEDLQVRNMSKSASGSANAPGRNVRAKSGLNKSILDQGWYEFRWSVDETTWNGGYLIAVPPQYTSQTCPQCGHVAKDNRKTQAMFACVECGFESNADLVGAIDI